MSIVYCIIGISLILFICIYISNNWLKITNYEVINKKVPHSMNNLKIVLISDVHGKDGDKNIDKIINKVKKIKPNIIIMAGDIIDDSCENIEEFVEMLTPLTNEYPIYYATGNHEYQIGAYKSDKYLSMLKDKGIHVLINEGVYYKKDDAKIKISAIKFEENREDIEMNKIGNVDPYDFNILIAHDPENFELYEKSRVDLVLSGHIHGGLIRFGKICLLSPRKSFFPKYGYGKRQLNNTTIITSSGIGKATIPIRLFNRPEIVKIVLKNK